MATIIKKIPTISGDTWSTLSQRAYGNCTLIGPLVNANPTLANIMIFDQGYSINVPLVTIAPQQIAGPPWSSVYALS